MTNIKKILFTGCSFVKGHGLENEDQDPMLWVNRLFDRNFEVNNKAKTGANNEFIFLETINELTKFNYDIVIVGWSAIPRFNMQVGIELWSTETLLKKGNDIELHGGVVISNKWLTEIGDRLRIIHNDHHDILKLIKYINVLTEIQIKTRNKKLFFVNSLCPWCNDYFTHRKITTPADLDPYVQNMLSIHERDDNDIFILYNKIHSLYKSYGGIRENLWLNLYSSLQKLQIDDISIIDKHPGYKSQDKFVEYLKPILELKINDNLCN